MKPLIFPHRTARKYLMVLVIGLLASGPVHAQDKPLSLEQLLHQVQQGQWHDRKTQERRLRTFREQKTEQARLLQDLRHEEQRLVSQSQQLEQRFADNRETVSELQSRLEERLGDMKELFGVLQQSSSESRSTFVNSPTELQFPERSQFLARFESRMSKTTELPGIADIERLWFELIREARESGRVVTFSGSVINAEGRQETADITRIGLFNLAHGNTYLQYVPETGQAVALQRQPAQSHTNSLSGLNSTSDAGSLVTIDPTRGQLLSMLIEIPDWQERLQQGGYIGWAILLVGLIALVVTLERYVALSRITRKVQHQLNRSDADTGNPLGRLLHTGESCAHCDLETLELKLGEQLLQELPRLQQRLLVIKVITVIAPLMGLLGTVTGMIFTFQAITLFGTGDPKLMAGGISQALVTTVMGLAVAIPGLLMHTLVSTRARKIGQILEEQAAGMIAERALATA